MIKVSVVLLTYNRADMLKKAIESVLRQTYKGFELIISDDCSTDNTKEVVESFKDDRIKYIKNSVNVGFVANWQNAISKAIGEYIIPSFADDDYFVYDDFIKDGISYFMHDKQIDVVFGRYDYIFGKTILSNLVPSIDKIITGEEIVKNFHIFHPILSLTSMIINRKCLNLLLKTELQLNYNTTSDDMALIFYMFLHVKKAIFLNKVVFHWRQSENNNSFSSKNDMFIYSNLKNRIAFADYLIPYLQKKGILNKFYNMFNQYFLHNFEESAMNYYLSQKYEIFNNLLYNNLFECYIYGYGQVGVLLKEFLEKNNIKVLGFVDDFKQDCLKVKEIDKSKDIIIATFKKSLIHKMYKNLIADGVDYKNIKELIL